MPCQTTLKLSCARLQGLALALVLVALLLPVSTQAGRVSLAWDPVPDSGLYGYRLFIGSSPGASDVGILDVGNVTSTTVNNLPDCIELYFGVKALDLGGNESSSFSGFVSGLPQPLVSGTTPDRLDQGEEAVTVQVMGANFTPGMQRADIQFDDPDLRVVDLQYISCTELELQLSAGPYLSNPDDPEYNGAGGIVEEVPPAAIGGRAATVTAPDLEGRSVRGETMAALEVEFVPSRTDIDGNGRVDGFDLAMMARGFGSEFALTSSYEPELDLDGDKSVDGIDLALLAEYFTTIF